MTFHDRTVNDHDDLRLVECGECCALIFDDAEGANRRQHEHWHERVEKDTQMASLGFPIGLFRDH